MSEVLDSTGERDRIYYANAVDLVKLSLNDLLQAIDCIVIWTDHHGEVLEYAYRFRIRALLRTGGSAEDCRALEDHLARVVHDGRKDTLNSLDRPYHALWTNHREMLEDRIAEIESGPEIAKEILATYDDAQEIFTAVRLTKRRGELISREELVELTHIDGGRLAHLVDMMVSNELLAIDKHGGIHLGENGIQIASIT